MLYSTNIVENTIKVYTQYACNCARVIMWITTSISDSDNCLLKKPVQWLNGERDSEGNVSGLCISSYSQYMYKSNIYSRKKLQYYFASYINMITARKVL